MNNRILQLVNELIEKSKVIKPPIPIEEIALASGAQIARHRFDGPESGFALRDKDRMVIGVNTLTNRRRQRFTIAHELGHLLLHQDKLRVHEPIRHNRDAVSSLAIDPKEIEANKFAAELLMPKQFVLSHTDVYMQTNSGASREDLVRHLAREFDVSMDAMNYRLINLAIIIP